MGVGFFFSYSAQVHYLDQALVEAPEWVGLARFGLSFLALAPTGGGEEGGTSPPAAQKAKCSADPSPHWPGGRGSEDIRSLLAPEVTWEELKVNWDQFFFF